MLSISWISNPPFSTITTYFSSSLSLVPWFLQFFTFSNTYNPLVLYLSHPSLLSLPHSLSFLNLNSMISHNHLLLEPLPSLLLLHTYLVKTPPLVSSNSPLLQAYIHAAECDHKTKYSAAWAHFISWSQSQVGPQCCPATILDLSSPFPLRDDYFIPSPVSSNLQHFLPHPHSQMSRLWFHWKRNRSNQERMSTSISHNCNYWPTYNWTHTTVLLFVAMDQLPLLPVKTNSPLVCYIPCSLPYSWNSHQQPSPLSTTSSTLSSLPNHFNQPAVNPTFPSGLCPISLSCKDKVINTPAKHGLYSLFSNSSPLLFSSAHSNQTSSTTTP